MQIETMSLDDIKRSPYNPRKPLRQGDKEYESIKKSLETFSLVNPLVWNNRTGNLVGGHQRLTVLEDMGETEVQVSVVDLSEGDEKLLNLALNKVQGVWDRDMLEELLTELAAEPDLNFEVSGFDENFMNDLQIETDLLGDINEVLAFDTIAENQQRDNKEFGGIGDYFAFSDVRVKMNAEERNFMLERYMEYKTEGDPKIGFVGWLFGLVPEPAPF